MLRIIAALASTLFLSFAQAAYTQSLSAGGRNLKLHAEVEGTTRATILKSDAIQDALADQLTDAKALEDLFGGRDRKGRGLLVVKGTKSEVISAPSFQLYEIAHHVQDLRTVLYLLNGVGRDHATCNLTDPDQSRTITIEAARSFQPKMFRLIRDEVSV